MRTMDRNTLGMSPAIIKKDWTGMHKPLPLNYKMNLKISLENSN
jgi:hypothetical protein